MCFLLELTCVSRWSRVLDRLGSSCVCKIKAHFHLAMYDIHCDLLGRRKRKISPALVYSKRYGKHVLVTVNKANTRSIHKMADTSQVKKFTIVGLKGTFQLSIANKDTENKQKKMEELADKLGFVQSFSFLQRFVFLIFSSSVSHCSTWVPLH